MMQLRYWEVCTPQRPRVPRNSSTPFPRWQEEKISRWRAYWQTDHENLRRMVLAIVHQFFCCHSFDRSLDRSTRSRLCCRAWPRFRPLSPALGWRYLWVRSAPHGLCSPQCTCDSAQTVSRIHLVHRVHPWASRAHPSHHTLRKRCRIGVTCTAVSHPLQRARFRRSARSKTCITKALNTLA